MRRECGNDDRSTILSLEMSNIADLCSKTSHTLLRSQCQRMWHNHLALPLCAGSLVAMLGFCTVVAHLLLVGNALRGPKSLWMVTSALRTMGSLPPSWVVSMRRGIMFHALLWTHNAMLVRCSGNALHHGSPLVDNGASFLACSRDLSSAPGPTGSTEVPCVF